MGLPKMSIGKHAFLFLGAKKYEHKKQSESMSELVSESVSDCFSE